jgi:hypothetical protein
MNNKKASIHSLPIIVHDALLGLQNDDSNGASFSHHLNHDDDDDMNKSHPQASADG